MKKALSFLLAAAMAVGTSVTAFAAAPAGEIYRAYLNGSGRITVDLMKMEYAESVVLKLMSGDTELTSSSLNTEEYPSLTGDITGSIGVANQTSSTWQTVAWTPKDDVVPTSVVLLVDGVEKNSVPIYEKRPIDGHDGAVIMDAADWEVEKGTIATVEASGKIVRAWLRTEKGRIYVDLQNVAFNESVELELYKDNDLLVETSLNTSEFNPGKVYRELTGSIGVEDVSSDTWPIEDWDAWDDEVPTAIKLVVDGTVVDTVEVIYDANPDKGGTQMTDEDWVNFPGTDPRPEEPEEDPIVIEEEEEEEEEEYISVTAKILWEGKAVSDGVEVKLLKNDKKYETKTLTSGKYKINNWRYTWSELDPEDDWTIEVIVPDGYECDIDEYGDNDFEITLTQIKTAASDTVEELNPNTGAI